MQTSILRTLNYADIFDYPLTAREVTSFLISDTEVKVEVVQKTLLILADCGLICTDGEFYFLKGREKIVKTRKRRAEWSEGKLKIAKAITDKLKFLPTIKIIGITGALAMENCKENDDIDLLIITSANCLWLTRLLIILLSPFLGIKRRKPKEKNVKDKICFNLFLDENHLRIQPENLFLAHEICQMKPVFDKDNIYNKFIKENEWVKKYLPNAAKITNHQPLSTNNNKGLLSFFNFLAFRLQYFYMKPKITNEKVSLHKAFFHPKDLSDKTLKEFERRIKSLVF